MMRALTLTQPWAGLVASGIKLVENRPRRMIKVEDYGRPFAIHANRQMDESVYKRAVEIAPELAPRGPYSWSDDRWYKLSRVAGAVIGVATISGCIMGRADLPFHEGELVPPEQLRWFFGPIGYVLRDVIALPQPVPCRGWQGFWTLPADVEHVVRQQLPCDAGGLHMVVGPDVQCSKCLAEVR